MAAGAFADLTADKSKFPNSSTWLKGLAGLGDLRRQADGRPVLRGLADRDLPQGHVQAGRDHEACRRASRSSSPTARSCRRRTAPTRRSRRSTSPARTGTRRSPSSTTTAGRSPRRPTASGPARSTSRRRSQGLTAFKNTFLALSRASKSTDEANPFPTTPFAQGHAASFVGPGWQFGYALDPKAGNPKLKPVMGAFPMPSHIAGKTMPAFLGGSDLAIPAASSNKDARRAVDRRLHGERRRWRGS